MEDQRALRLRRWLSEECEVEVPLSLARAVVRYIGDADREVRRTVSATLEAVDACERARRGGRPDGGKKKGSAPAGPTPPSD